MFKVHEMMGNTSKEVAMFDTESEAQDYLEERWDEAREEAILFHDSLEEYAVKEDFLSYFDIEDDNRESISEDELMTMYDDMLDEMGEIKIGYLGFYPSNVLEKCDPIAYNCGLNDFYNSIIDQYYCEEME